MCLNCSFSVKSTKFGTETVFKMTKKIGFGAEANLKQQFCPVKGDFQNGGHFEPEVELIWTKTRYCI